jgi:hypothetical protein
MQRVEIGAAVHAQDHSLAVDDKLLDPILQRGFRNPRKALGPVMAALGGQPEAVPSYFTSWNHSGAAGTALPIVGRQKSNLNIGADIGDHARSYESGALNRPPT